MLSTYSRNYIRLGALFLLYLLLSLKRDGYFLNELNLLLVALMLGLISVFCFAGKLYRFSRVTDFIGKHLQWVAFLSILLNISLIVIFLYQSVSAFPDYYHLPTGVLITAFLLAVVITCIPVIAQNARWAIVSLFVCSLLLFCLPIIYFDISANTADLLPVIQRQLQELSSGHNIYQYYLLDNGVVTAAVRQPGAVLFFWPSFALGLDLRWMSVLFTLATGIVVWLISGLSFKKAQLDKHFWLVYAVVGWWLLFPYRHVRHDLYEASFWFLLALATYLLSKSKLKLFSIAWGLAIFTQVWAWLFTPFVCLYLYKRYGWRRAAGVSLAFLLIGGGLLALFILPNPQAYLEHVFGFYAGEIAKANFAQTTIHLTPLVYSLGLSRFLLPIQILATGGVFLLALRYLRSFQSLLLFLALALFVFIQFNSVSWNYMYINLLLLLSMCLLLPSESGTLKVSANQIE